MAATLVSTLYPPTIDTFQNAFVHTEAAKVYFSLSAYNEKTNIKRVHVSLVNQKNNENALAASSGILFLSYNYDTSVGLYYVEILPDYLTGGVFNTNQFYKIQLRFDGYENSEVDSYSEAEKNEYLLNYQTYFSEWSSVCLLRPISKPIIQLRQFDTSNASTKPYFNKGLMPISGKVYFMTASNEVDSSETETLQSYIVQVLDASNEEILWTSSTIYTADSNNANEINTKIDLQELDNTDRDGYLLRINAITKNQYSFSKDYEFGISQYDTSEAFEAFNPNITITKDDESGIVSINVSNQQTILGWTVYIRRSSSLDGFSTWEDIWSKKIRGKLDVTVKDTTVSSLVWYKYTVQAENNKGNMSMVYPVTTTADSTNIVLPEFYDAILSRGDKLFRIWYDYKISSMKPVVNRTKIDTLGGKYPKFAENAILNYKQFSISGMITAEEDVYQTFLAKNDVYSSAGSVNVLRSSYLNSKSRANAADGSNSDEYIDELVRNDVQQYNIDEGMNGYPNTSDGILDTSSRFLTTTTNDWMWEREFREELISWLNDGKPKLYRSMAEGAMVVMLTDISLTPNANLSRRVWSFSATMYEVADATSLETLDDLGIYNRVSVDESTDDTLTPDGEEEYVDVVIPGQLYHYTPTPNVDVLSEIKNTMELRYGGVLEDKKADNFYLKNIRIIFEGKPNLYIPDGQGNLLPVNNGETYSDYSNMVLGYKFTLQPSGDSAKTIFVNSRGRYQIPNSVDVTRLSFSKADVVTIDYNLAYREKADQSATTASTEITDVVIGQSTGVFEPKEYLGDSIRQKYTYHVTDQYTQQMQYWRGISLDVTPFAVASIKYYGENKYSSYLVGSTGVLNLLRDTSIIDMCFLGRRMKQVDASRSKYLDDIEYVLDENAYSKKSDIVNPVRNNVYSIGNSLKIYYSDGQWYDFEKQDKGVGLAKVPIQGSVNYYGSIVRVNYQQHIRRKNEKEISLFTRQLL